MAAFAGLWHRTRLEEPAGHLVAAPPQRDVRWLQSAQPAGLFVDLRRGTAGLRDAKAFAGRAAYDAAAGLLTWRRAIDLRAGAGAPATADAGRMSWRGLTLVEDAALPGDDYREEWVCESAAPAAVGPARAPSSFACELVGPLPGQRGVLVVEGGHFGVALGRGPAPSTPDDDAAALAAFFAGAGDAAAERRAGEYRSCLGLVEGLAVTAALDPEHERLSLAEALPELRSWRAIAAGDGVGAAGAGAEAFLRLMLPLSPVPEPELVTRVYIVRHGETHWNVEGRLQGQLDTPLNDLGRLQAAAAGRFLAMRIAAFASSASPSSGTAAAVGADASATPVRVALVASDLQRAFHTAEAIGAALGGLAPRPEPRLRETHLGAWQGGTWAEAEAAAPRAVARWRADPDFAVPGGGESVRQRFARVAAALHEAALAHAGGQVVLVAHGGVIDDVGRLVRATPFGQSTRLSKLNAAISVLEFRPHGRRGGTGVVAGTGAGAGAGAITPESAARTHGEWRLIEWGNIEHLAELSTRADPLADSAQWAGSGVNGAAVGAAAT